MNYVGSHGDPISYELCIQQVRRGRPQQDRLGPSTSRSSRSGHVTVGSKEASRECIHLCRDFSHSQMNPFISFFFESFENGVGLLVSEGAMAGASPAE